MVSTGYINTFCSERRNKLWNIIEKRGIPKHIVHVIRRMYIDIEVGPEYSSALKAIVSTVVRQECSFIYSIFNLYSYDTARK